MGSSTDHRTAPDGTVIPSFAPELFVIYHWPAPKPAKKDFPQLSQSHRNWKKKQDQLEGRVDQFLDGPYDADDWTDFAGNPLLYDGDALATREYSIGRTFVNRAKRAFRRGWTWEMFEKDEEAIDSLKAANIETNADRRALLLEEHLDNDLRLAVFDALKERLCNEIWLEKYIPNEASLPQDSKANSRSATPSQAAPPANGHPEERTVEKWETTASGLPRAIFKD